MKKKLLFCLILFSSATSNAMFVTHPAKHFRAITSSYRCVSEGKKLSENVPLITYKHPYIENMYKCAQDKTMSPDTKAWHIFFQKNLDPDLLPQEKETLHLLERIVTAQSIDKNKKQSLFF